LHALAMEKGGQERAHKEIEEWFPARVAELKSKHELHVNLPGAGLKGLVDGYGVSSRVVKLLADYMERSERQAAQSFYLTNIGRAVWETLDWCREERRPCFIEGLEGRGKSASARAWCNAHRGEARYVSLPGLGHQRDFFSALADAYGMPFSHAKSPSEIRFRLRDVIVRSGLVLVIDEAHFCLPERTRAGRPALVDWIDTELCNAGVAVALVSTPQFGPRLAEFEERTTWNARQFKRRFSGCWRSLDSKTSEADLTALAEKFLPQVGANGIKIALGYAGTFGRDVSGLFDLVRDAERRARKAGHSVVTYQDLRNAFEQDRVPTENAMAAAFKRPRFQQPGEAPDDTLPLESEPAADLLQRRGSPVAATEFTTPRRVRPEAELVSVT
jgi:hypothetical protein